MFQHIPIKCFRDLNIHTKTSQMCDTYITIALPVYRIAKNKAVFYQMFNIHTWGHMYKHWIINQFILAYKTYHKILIFFGNFDSCWIILIYVLNGTAFNLGVKDIFHCIDTKKDPDNIFKEYIKLYLMKWGLTGTNMTSPSPDLSNSQSLTSFNNFTE
jgi:hypothetical protein